jgi:hypothetical protein
MRGERPFGREVVSDADGQYTITAPMEEGEDLAPSVRVAVVDSTGVELASPAVRYGAATTEPIDVSLPSGFGGRPRFDHYLAAVEPALGAVPLAEAQPADVAFLAGATGIPASHLDDLIEASVRAAAGAAGSADRGAFPSDVWFGWKSAGLDLQRLWRIPTDDLVGTLARAGESGTIAARTADELASIGKRIDEVKLELVLESPAPGISAPLGSLLSTMPTAPARDQQRVIAGAIHQLRPDDPRLVERIAAIPRFEGNAASVARTLRLGQLTEGNLAMIESLQTRLDGSLDADGTLEPLAALGVDEWIELAYAHGTPNPQGQTPIAYARNLAAAVEKQYPTAALAANLSDGRLGQQPTLGELTSFLRANPSFDITKANIDLLNETNSVPDGVDPDHLTTQLRTLQRMNALGASWDETATLIDQDVASPQDILTAGPAQLSSQVEGQISPDRIAAIYDRARDLHDTTFALFTAALSPFSGPKFLGQRSPEVDPDSDDPGDQGEPIGPGPFWVDAGVHPMLAPRQPAALETERPEIPPEYRRHGEPTGREPLLDALLQQLFGAQDLCACDHCASVLSPAAYLVDLLKFVDDTPGLGSKLMGYRPDLLDLELSCSNTYTEVPAIDLALEILENAVALPLEIDLAPGTRIEAELGQPVGQAVRDALQKTVSTLVGSVNATAAGSRELGTSDWTVVDAHRRWTLTARPEDALHAESAAGRGALVDVTNLDRPGLIAALDQGSVPESAQASLIRLFTKSRLPVANYRLTVTPVIRARKWSVDYQFVAEMVFEPDRQHAALRTPTTEEIWWESTDSNLIRAIEEELSGDTDLAIIKKLFETRFESAPLKFEPQERGVWLISSTKRSMTLSFQAARLTLTSLAYQSGDSAADAIAWPENHNPAAYEKLKGNDIRFPWSLPLDLPLEQIRLCLERARSSRRKLIELMAPLGDVLAHDRVFVLEVLGMSASEANLVAPSTQPSDSEIYASWGIQADARRIWDAAAGTYFNAASALELLKNNVSILLQQSQLSFEELQTVLATQFVTHGGPALTIEPRGSCIPSEMKIAGLTPEHLDRICRFVRLQRRLGWSAEDLDAAIPTGAQIDYALLERLAHLSQLRDRLSAPLKIILAWWKSSAVEVESKRALAHALKLSSAEFDHALALLSLAAPFTSPADTLAFCERVIALRRSTISFEDLRYVLQHKETPGSDLALSLDERIKVANAIREAVKSVVDAPADSSPVAADPAAAAAAAQAARLRTESIRRAQQDAAIGVLATLLGAPRELVDYLLRDTTSTNAPLREPTDPDHAAAIDALTDAAFLNAAAAQLAGSDADAVLTRLHKTLFVCSTLALEPADLRLLGEPPAAQAALDLNSLPIAPAPTATTRDFEELLAFLDLRATAPRALALDFSNQAQARAVLAAALNVADPTEIQAAADRLKITTADEYRSPITRARIVQLLSELTRLGATMNDATALVEASPDDTAATTAKDLLHEKYDESSWRELIKPISDALRERQRDALVDYLVGPGQLRNRDELYERYLIDVETGSCLKTTRLLQAIAAVQLFIQRVLLNLEPGAALTDHQRSLWEWMHSYRIWEANRKVFLFPENWLLPELRDDKTAIFRQLESAVSQEEPTPNAAHAALRSYLDDLNELAQINVIAMYEAMREIPGPGRMDYESTLYVVGRTPNQPYRYYWRTCTRFAGEEMAWSGWEALDADDANDFILPFVLEGDLHVAWPIFRQTRDEATAMADAAGNKSVEALRWEVQMAWSRRSKDGWTKRKLSHDVLTLQRLLGVSQLRSFVFRLSQDAPLLPMATELREDRIRIDCYAATDSLLSHAVVNENKEPPEPGDVEDNNAWNVALEIRGRVVERYQRDQQWIYRAAPTVTVTLEYDHRDDIWGNSTHKVTPLEVKTTGDPADSTFYFWAPWDESEAVKNGTNVTVKLVHPDVELSTHQYVQINPQTLQQTLQDANGNQFRRWNWNPVVVFTIPGVPADDKYRSDRPLAFGTDESGTFLLTSTRDMQLTTPSDAAPPDGSAGQQGSSGLGRLGNQFHETVANGTVVRLPYPFGEIDVGHELVPDAGSNRGADIVMTEATTVVVKSDSSMLTASGGTWHLRDASGQYYATRTPSAWKTWPDGQAFTPYYRSIAAVSATALFTPAKQALALGSGPQPPLGTGTTASTISFERASPYANYNWELFLHVPFAIAAALAINQRFADARRWLHGVLDPTISEKLNGIPQYWRFLRFKNGLVPDAIAKRFEWLANPNAVDPADTAEEERLFGAQITDWQNSPFMPHLIARLRPSAYQWYAFFAYIELLINWGDQLFRRDTRESVNDATILYIFAAKLLGPRPRTIPRSTDTPPQTYRLLAASPLDMFGNAWMQYADIPGFKNNANTKGGSWSSIHRNGTANADRVNVEPDGVALGATRVLTSLGGLAFCIPRNDKLVGFYDLIDDRLWKVRHCQNIDGVSRELPLYDPPIDPLLLIKARAAGLDIDAAVSGLYAPLPHYRFAVTFQKALELAGEVKALGSALLTALDRQDATELELVRSRHEVAMLKLVRDTRQQQMAEAEANIVALQQSEATVKERFSQYQKLLGTSSISAGQDGLPVVQQSSSLAVATDPTGVASRLGLSGLEVNQLLLNEIAQGLTQAAGVAQVASGVLAAVPNTEEGTPFYSATFGGWNLSSIAGAVARAIEMSSSITGYLASRVGTMSSYERRQDEWVFQSKLAAAELSQINKQILAAQIRKEIAQLDLDQHETQITNAEEIETFLRGKFTNKELFRWMSSQVAQVYFRSYQLALDQARRAERAYRHELGLEENAAPIVQSGYWDNQKKGLVAGDQLHHDLRRMEAAYLDQNKREYEITKHVSLAMTDPVALMTLKQSSECWITLPEALFDIDYPGHYMRRIKTVSVSIPCVTGPYASVNCTLSLQSSSIRRTSVLRTTDPKYARDVGNSDDRFVDDFATTQSIVTSGAQNDPGLFEANLRDERYLPFEGAGVISRWLLRLTSQLKQLDYDTISDVVLHIRYTARGSDRDDFANAAIASLKSALAGLPEKEGDPVVGLGGRPLALIVNLRQQYPSEWARLTAPGIDTPREGFPIDVSRFPFVFKDHTLTIQRVDLFASGAKASPELTLSTPPSEASRPPEPIPLLSAALSDPRQEPFLHVTADDYAKAGTTERTKLALKVSTDATAAEWTVSADAALTMLSDVVVVLTYTATPPPSI